jgi:hypothetical protein
VSRKQRLRLIPRGTDAITTWSTNGNATSITGVVTATYDTANRTTSMTRSGTTDNMTYAGTGQAERAGVGSSTVVNGLLGIASKVSSRTTD